MSPNDSRSPCSTAGQLVLRRLLTASTALIATCLASSMAHAVSLELLVADLPQDGFNDPTSFVPVGGNLATTLGDARLNALQFAANIWGQKLESDVPIQVLVRMAALDCDAVSGTVSLGSASPMRVFRDYSGALQESTWYPVALANSLAGTDLNDEEPEIRAQFNGSFGSENCFPNGGFYYGLDSAPPLGQLDFVSIALHELAHGLGMQTLLDRVTGAKPAGLDDIYLTQLVQLGSGNPSVFEPLSEMGDADRAAAVISDGDLYWMGPRAAREAQALNISAGLELETGFIRLHAPPVVQPASSVAHLDLGFAPDELMEPQYVAPNHSIDLTLALLSDLGWRLAPLPVPLSGMWGGLLLAVSLLLAGARLSLRGRTGRGVSGIA